MLESIKKGETRGYSEALVYASAELKKDKQFILVAVQEDGKVLEYADTSLTNNKDIVLTAVQEDGFALKFVGNELKRDKDVVLAAVQNWGYALEYANKDLRNDKEVVLAAIQVGGGINLMGERIGQEDAQEYAITELKKDKDVVITAVKSKKISGHGSSFLEFIDDTLKEDSVFMNSVLEIDDSLLSINWVSTKVSDYKIQGPIELTIKGMGVEIVAEYIDKETAEQIKKEMD